MNGDSLLPNLDFPAMKKAHAGTGALATIAVTWIREAGRYGTVERDASEKVTAFREKENRTEGWVNGGVYLLNKQAWNGYNRTATPPLKTISFRDGPGGCLYASPSSPLFLTWARPGDQGNGNLSVVRGGSSLRPLPGRNNSTHCAAP